MNRPRRSTGLVLLLALTWPGVQANAASAQEPSGQEPGDTTEGAAEAKEPPAPLAPGVGVVMLSGGLAILEADGINSGVNFGGAFALQIVGSPEGWPVMVGLGGGITVFNASRQAGPLAGTTVDRTLELRHVELALRIQPWWWVVRPFLDGFVGLAVLWELTTLAEAPEMSPWDILDPSGSRVVIRSSENQRSAGLLYGASLGIDWPFYSSGPGGRASVDFTLTAGLAYWGTTAMVRPTYTSEDGQLGTQRKRLSIWTPFIAISFVVDSRSSALQPQDAR